MICSDKIKKRMSSKKYKVFFYCLISFALFSFFLIPNFAQAATSSISIGENFTDGINAPTVSNFGIAIGNVETQATGLNGAIAIGRTVTATGERSTAIGSNTSTSGGDGSVAIGADVTLTDFASVGIGSTITASGADSVGIGSNVTATGDRAVAIGGETKARSFRSIAIGEEATAGNADGSSWNTISIGAFSQATGGQAVSVGLSAEASGIGSTAIGDQAIASGLRSSAFGSVTQATGNYAIALGAHSQAPTDHTISVGSGLAADATTYQYRRITNVANPVDANDAANKGYVDTAVNKLDRRIDNVGAMQMSVANAQIPIPEGKHTAIGVGVGSYQGARAATLGLVHRLPGNFQFSGNFTIANAGEKAGGVGVGYTF